MKDEVKGEFKFEQDSKRYHRFKIEADENIVGMIYVPKSATSMPLKIILERVDDAK
jgi:hypothetical protein